MSSSDDIMHTCFGRLLQVLKYTLVQYGRRTTLHGLLHMFNSRDRCRRTFWLILLLAAVSAALYHTVYTAKEFLSEPIVSQMRMMSEKAVFPDVTLCNLKPGSETLVSSLVLKTYIQNYWGYFDDWVPDERKRKPGEGKVDFHERLRRIYGRFFEIMWVSGDTRDIGILDKTMSLHCDYNGMHCNHRNFSLVQNSRFWNCYTFSVDPLNTVTGIGGRGAQLEIVGFTDGYNQVHLQKKSTAGKSKIGSIYIKGRATEEKVPFSLREYLDGGFGINQLLTEGSYEPGGIRIFIHENKIYPTLSREYLDIQSGTSSIITIRPIVHTLISGATHQCTEPNELVEYVRYFGHGSNNIGRRKFLKTETDYVVAEKQNLMYDMCGCYSHKYPFQVNNSKLCYYVSPENWKIPPESVLKNIECHDKWIQDAEKKTFELMQRFKKHRLCKFTRFRPSEQSSNWPRSENVVDIWQDLFVPQIMDSSEFLKGDMHNHHIFNISNMKDYGTTREELVFFPLLFSDKRCMLYFCNSSVGANCNLTLVRNVYKNAGKCIDQTSMARNVVALRVNLLAATADSYIEEGSFGWMEALSEVGGILGLWLGVSLLVVFELLELLYLLVINCVRSS